MQYQRYSSEQISLANSINLIDFLKMQGETLIKSGKDMRWSRNPSVTIRDNQWFKHKTQEGGYPIKFLQEFYNYDFKQAMELLLSTIGDVELVSQLAEKSQPKPFEAPEKNDNNRRAYAYLNKTRLIDKDVLNYFFNNDLIYEDKEYHNAVFVGLDEDGVIRHAHKKSTLVNTQKSYRGNVESSDARYTFHYNGKYATVFVFEAPIDMLSYITLHKSNWQDYSYIALNGLGIQGLEHLLEHNKNIKQIILCFDHDVAGLEATERVSDVLFEKGYSEVGIYCPQEAKDFNEVLKAKAGLEFDKAIDNPKYIYLNNVSDGVKELSRNMNISWDMDILKKEFTELYYKHRERTKDYRFLNEKFNRMSACAINMRYQLLSRMGEVTSMSELNDAVLDNYRAYKDIGDIQKRVKRVTECMREVKLSGDEFITNGSSYQRLSKALLNVSTESLAGLNYLKMEQVKEIEISKNIESTEREIEEKKFGLDDMQRPKAKLIGENGNIFNLMGIASNTLNNSGFNVQAKEMVDRIRSSKSYDEALGIIWQYVEPVGEEHELNEENSLQMEGY